MRTVVLMGVVVTLLAWSAQEAEPIRSYVVNGGFEAGQAGWSLPPRAAGVLSLPPRGQCLEIRGAATASQDVWLGAHRGTLTVAVDLKAEGITPAGGRGYAFAAVYQLDERGQMAAYRDFIQVPDRAEWSRQTFTFEIAPTAVTVSLRCGIFNATGTAWFDNWTLVAGPVARRLDEVASPAPDTGTPDGVVGIFREEGFPAAGAASSPHVLHAALSAAGITVRFLSAAELADPAGLRPDAVDVVILPYGASFPAAARDSFISYLHRGGDFISMGGYAFNQLLVRQGQRWVPEAEDVAARLAAALAPGRSMLHDGGFEGPAAPAAAGWQRMSEAGTVVAEEPREGKRCARLTVPPERGDGQAGWEQRVPAVPGRRYRVKAARTQDIVCTGFAYLALYQQRPGQAGGIPVRAVAARPAGRSTAPSDGPRRVRPCWWRNASIRPRHAGLMTSAWRTSPGSRPRR